MQHDASVQKRIRRLNNDVFGDDQKPSSGKSVCVRVLCRRLFHNIMPTTPSRT